MKNTTTEKINIAGMGAIIHENGVFFRVWAPNAKNVSVIGSFNDWNDSNDALTHEENGYWGGNIENAKAGDEYKFCIETHHGKLQRNDPYAKELTNSVGNSIVYNHNNFDWQDDNFQMPSWNNLVIYELHVGTFHVKEKGKIGKFSYGNRKVRLFERFRDKCY